MAHFYLRLFCDLNDDCDRRPPPHRPPTSFQQGRGSDREGREGAEVRRGMQSHPYMGDELTLDGLVMLRLVLLLMMMIVVSC